MNAKPLLKMQKVNYQQGQAYASNFFRKKAPANQHISVALPWVVVSLDPPQRATEEHWDIVC